MNHSRTAARLGAGAILTTALVTAAATSASAHVTVTPSTTAAGSYTVLTFSNGHGCDGSPTTKITISIPEGIYSVAPTRNPDYTIEKVMETLDTPIDDGHGGQYTERVGQVVYTAKTPLPDGYRDAFELSLKLPEADAGTALAFPTIQTCEVGETAWIDEVVEGGEEPENPAPTFTLTAAEAGGHGSGGGYHSSEETGHDEESSSSPLGWIAIAIGAVGALTGGTALARSKKQA